MKKKVVSLALSIILAAAATGCGEPAADANVTDGSTTIEENETAKAAAPEAQSEENNDSEEAEASGFVGDGLNTATVIHAGYQGSDTLYWLDTHFHWLEEEFAPDGITVEYEQFLSGPPMIESMAADRLDIATIGDMPPINARGNGIDVKVITKVVNTPFSNSIVLPNGSEVKSIADLKGKKIATQVGSSGHHFVSLLLDREGLSLEDVELVNLSGPDQLAALENGKSLRYQPGSHMDHRLSTGE